MSTQTRWQGCADTHDWEPPSRADSKQMRRLDLETMLALLQVEGHLGAKEDLDREKAKNKKLWNAPLTRESRQERAREMFAKYDFTPFIEEGVDMATTYQEGVMCMYSIFNDFFSLDHAAINKRTWTQDGKKYTGGLFYLLQDMGLQRVDDVMFGLGYILYDKETKNKQDTPEKACLGWFRRLNEYGLNIAEDLECLKPKLTEEERAVMDRIWTEVQNFMKLFHYHYQAPTNFGLQQAVWVYRED